MRYQPVGRPVAVSESPTSRTFSPDTFRAPRSTLCIRMIDRLASLHFSRRRLRRAVGFVLLAVFMRQSTALGWTPSCHEAVGVAAATSMDSMAGMTHDQHDAGGGARPAPVPERKSDCDHTVPTAACGFGIGCVVAVPGTALIAAAPRAALRIDFPAPGSAPRALEFAPDTPPPRS